MIHRPTTPTFARAAVNHLWAHFFGIGIIDPIDEPSDENPPSHSRAARRGSLQGSSP